MIVIHITTARSRGFLSELSSLLNVTRRFWLLGAEREREREETIRTLHDATRIAKKKKKKMQKTIPRSPEFIQGVPVSFFNALPFDTLYSYKISSIIFYSYLPSIGFEP